MPGPFYFAWLNGPEPFNPDYHAITDEQVSRFEMTHGEGEYPLLSIDIENPRVGLLSRPFWAWLSWDRNWVEDESHTPDIVPLFLGRLLGIPNSLNKEIITLEFVARPKDHAAQRIAVSDALRVLPYYDPVFVSPDMWNDPDTVLEGYSRLWHFDRVTHVVSTSDIVEGEEGVQEFLESEIPYDSVELSLSQAPFVSVQVEATAKWTQIFNGYMPQPITTGTLKTLTGGSIVQDWPEENADLGGGYFARQSYCIDLWGTENLEMMSFSTSWNNPASKPSPGATQSSSLSSSRPSNWGATDQYVAWPLTTHTQAGVAKSSVETTDMYIQYWFLQYNLNLAYHIERPRTEVLRFSVRSNIQPILTDPDEVEVHEIQLTANDVDRPIPAIGAVPSGLPIGDLSRKSFFETGRGQQSLQYLMSRARAALTNAARCVEASCVIPFERAVGLTCRMNGIIHDPRIPGGQAIGKIKEYSFRVDGESGEMRGNVVIACCVGYGNAIVVEPGVGTYAANDWDVDYQTRAGKTVVLPGGNIAYTLPTFAGQDDGARMPLTKQQIVANEVWHQGGNAVPPALNQKGGFGSSMTPTDIRTAAEIADASVQQLTDNPTWYELHLRDLNSTFVNPYDVATATLELPKQIDLEFGAS